MVPETSPGVAREMKMIAAEFHEKTVVWMGASDYGPGRLIADRWNEVRAALMQEGIRLPEHSREGMLYIPNPDFSVKVCRPLYALGPTVQSDVILDSLRGECRPLSDVMRDLLRNRLKKSR